MPISKAQLRWAHTPTGEKALGSSRVKQWDQEAKGVDLPERSAGGEVAKNLEREMQRKKGA